MTGIVRSTLRRAIPWRSFEDRSGGCGVFGRPGLIGQIFHEGAEHDEGPAVENEADADKETDYPGAGDGPLAPDHEPESEGDGAMKDHPSPVGWAGVDGGDDAEESFEDEDEGDEEGKDDGGGFGIGENEGSADDVEHAGEEVEEKAAPADFLGDGMDDAGDAGDDHEPGEESHGEDGHDEGFADGDGADDDEKDSEEEEPAAVLFDFVDAWERKCLWSHGRGWFAMGGVDQGLSHPGERMASILLKPLW